MCSLKVAMLHNSLPIGGVRGKHNLMRSKEFALIGSNFAKKRSSINISVLSIDIEGIAKVQQFTFAHYCCFIRIRKGIFTIVSCYYTADILLF